MSSASPTASHTTASNRVWVVDETPGSQPAVVVTDAETRIKVWPDVAPTGESNAVADRLYPQAFDEAVQSGQAMVYLRQALADANCALNFFSDGDLAQMSSQLNVVAVALKCAYEQIDFNDSLAGVVDFLRRATLTVDSAGVSIGALNMLVSAIAQLVSNPMLMLHDAADIAEKLSSQGWEGEHEDVDAIIKALLAEDRVADPAQAALFQDIGEKIE